MSYLRVAVLLLGIARVTSAQVHVDQIQPGMRLRLVAPPRYPTAVKVNVVGRRGDTLSVVPRRGAAFDVTTTELHHVEVSEGKSRMLGAGVGALWLGGIYGALGLILGPADCGGCASRPSRAKAAFFAAYMGAGGGAFWGFVIGREKWTPIVATRRVGAAPHGDRQLMLGVSVAR